MQNYQFQGDTYALHTFHLEGLLSGIRNIVVILPENCRSVRNRQLSIWKIGLFRGVGAGCHAVPHITVGRDVCTGEVGTGGAGYIYWRGRGAPPIRRCQCDC